MQPTTKTYLVQPGESEVRYMGETSTQFLATGALTDGGFALVEERALRGESVPLHLHPADREAFYVLEGEVSFFLGDGPPRLARAGTFVYVPGGSVHGFRVESEVARYLIFTTAHHGEFYRAISRAASGMTIDEAVIEKACQEYGIELVGALPT